MAMIPCPECKKQISDNAESCPNCGYKLSQEKIDEIKNEGEKKQNFAKIGCFTIIIISAILYIIGSSTDSEKKSAPKSKQELRKEQIEKSFSAWDGSHRGLTNIIKQSMNDPGSYEHVKTVYWDKGNHLIVQTTFRGKNAFGGLVVNWIKAKVDLDGNVIKVIAQGP